MHFKPLLFLIIISSLFILLLPSLTNAAPVLTIQDLSDSPDPFSPNADGIDDITTISATISASGFKGKKPLKLNWEVAIRDSQGKLVKKFKNKAAIENNSQNTVTQVWDGQDKTKTTVVNGKYTYKIDARIQRVKAEPKFGDFTVTGILPPPKPTLIIKDIMDSPDPFSPNSDGIDDTTKIRAKISISGFGGYLKKTKKLVLIWKLAIRDSKGKPVRLFVHSQNVQNDSEVEVSQIWDGKSFRGKVVSDGKYTYTIDARIRRIKAAPGMGEVTVKTVSGLSVSVSPEFWVIGEVEVNSVITMSEVDKITVINDGEANTTYSLFLINPQGWKASQTETGPETYILNAAFDSDGLLTWDETNHALSTEPVRASLSKFAGDQTGIDVEPGQQRTLWLQFKAPTATSIDTEQNIEVIITAELP